MPCQFLQDIGPARGHHHPRPSLANARPVARPIPLEAPVTTTTAPSSFLPMLITRFPSYERFLLDAALGEPVARSRSNPASSITAAMVMNTRS